MQVQAESADVDQMAWYSTLTVPFRAHR